MRISVLIQITAGEVDEIFLYESAAEAEADYYRLLREFHGSGSDKMTEGELDEAQDIYKRSVPDGNWFELYLDEIVFRAPASRQAWIHDGELAGDARRSSDHAERR